LTSGAATRRSTATNPKIASTGITRHTSVGTENQPHEEPFVMAKTNGHTINTVMFEHGTAVGHNTDWSGFARGLEAGLPGVPLDSVVLLGAGGAGAAVAHGLLTAGAEAGENLASDVGGAAGLVHATPTGMSAHPGLPLPAGLLRPGLW
jgi:shikimate 5-dehydrogenase